MCISVYSKTLYFFFFYAFVMNALVLDAQINRLPSWLKPSILAFEWQDFSRGWNYGAAKVPCQSESQWIRAGEEDKGNDREADTRRLIPNATSHGRGGSKSHMCHQDFNFESTFSKHWVHDASSGAALSSLGSSFELRPWCWDGFRVGPQLITASTCASMKYIHTYIQ